MKLITAAWLAAAASVLFTSPGRALDHDPGPGSHQHGSLHFSHPIIAESPSPDTKVRLDYFLLDADGDEGATESVLRFEGEYAFHRFCSVEFDLPVVLLNPDGVPSVSSIGNIEIGLKFANFVLEDKGLLLGYGIEFGFPTGDRAKGIGSDHIFEYEPFMNIGYKRQELEVVAFGSFGIPTNQRPGEEVETELGYDLSVLYHLSPRLQGLLEFGGETVLSGEEEGHTVINFTPGAKIAPLSDAHLQVGIAAGFPVTGAEEFDVRAALSVFYHF